MNNTATVRTVVSVMIVCLVGGVLVQKFFHGVGPNETATAQSLIEIQRIDPPPDAGQTVMSSTGENIKFKYEIRNRQAEPLRGLYLNHSCACEVTGHPPDEIPSGGVAQIGFQLRAPPYGTVTKEFSLRDDSHQVVATFSTSVRVDIEVPLLAVPFEELHETFVRGDTSPRELTLRTIEERGAEYWIEGIELAPDDLINVDSMVVHERVQPDRKLLDRTYRFSLVLRKHATGHYHGTVAVRTRERTRQLANTPLLTIEVVDPVSLIPDRITLGAEVSRRVVLIQRLREGQILPPQYDHDLIDVRAMKGLEGRAVVFEVSTRTNQPIETRVIFPLRDGSTKELLVNTQPRAGE